MPLIDDLRQRYPGYGDDEIADAYAKRFGLPAEAAYSEIGYAPKTLAGDVGNALKQGVEQLPGQVAGLADLPFAAVGLGRPITRAADWVGEVTGFQPGIWAKESQQNDMSPEYYRQQQNVQEVWDDPSKGVLDTAMAYMQNPRVTGVNIAQSVPGIAAMGAGGRVLMGVGRAGLGAAAEGMGPVRAGMIARAVGQRAAAPVAGGIAEGLQQTGQQMSEYDVNAPEQARNAFASLGTGIGTGLITGGAGRFARGLGFETVETAMIGGRPVDLLEGLAKRPMSMGGRIAAGAATEGLLEETPQSALQQFGQNWANRAPLDEGVARAAVEGGIAGAAMGGAFNVRTSRSRAAWQRDVDEAKRLYGDPAAPDEVRMQAAQFLEKVAPAYSLSIGEATDLLNPVPSTILGPEGMPQFDAFAPEIDRQQGANAAWQQRVPETPVDLDAAYTAAQQQVEMQQAQAEEAQRRAPPRITTPPVGMSVNTPAFAQIQALRDQADQLGITPAIEDMLAEKQPVGAIVARLSKQTPGMTPKQRTALVVGVRTTLGVPSRATPAGKEAFTQWQTAYAARRAPAQPLLGGTNVAQAPQTQQGQAQGQAPASAVAPPVEAPPAPESGIGAIPAAAQPITQGVQDGNIGQVIPPGSGQAPGGQAGAAPQAVVQAGEASLQTAQGTEAVQVAVPEVQQRLDAIEAKINALPEEAVPPRPTAAKIPGRAPLDEAGVLYVAKAINQGTSKEAKGPYALLFNALRAWDRAMNRFGTAKTAGKQEQYYGHTLEATRGQAGSIDAVVPLLYAMEAEFGTDTMNKIMGKLKTGWSEKTKEKAGINQVSPHVRLSAAWRAYRDGNLTAREGAGAARGAAVRGNKVEEALDAQLRKEGVVVDEKMADQVNEKGLLKYLAGASWQGFAPEIHSMSRMLHHFFSERGEIPTIVFADKPNGNKTGAYNDGSNTLTIYPLGRNPLTFLHELLHAATQRHILYADVSKARDELLKTLAQFAKLHEKAYAGFTKDLPPEVAARLDVAVKNVVTAYKKAGTDKAKQRVAVAEFVAYGLTNLDFQEYMKSLGIAKIESPYVLKQVAPKNRPGMPAKNSRLGVWSRFLNGMSLLLTGKSWTKQSDLTILDQFLSDTTWLLEEAGPVAEESGAAKAEPEPKRPLVEKVKAAVAKNKELAEKPKPKPKAPTKPDAGVSELHKGDIVELKDGTPGVVSKTLGGDAYFVISGPTREQKRVTRENMTLVKAKGQTLNSEAPAEPLKIGALVSADGVQGRIVTSRMVDGEQQVKVVVKGNAPSAWTPAAQVQPVAKLEVQNTLFSEAPAFPYAGQTIDPAKLNTIYDPRWARKESIFAPIFASMGYTGMVERTGEKLTKMAEAFALAFPNAAKWISYIDENFGLPKVLSREWKLIEAQSHYPKLTANALARMMENIPLEDQQKVLSYLDGEPTIISDEAKQLADQFMNAFDALMDEYMLHVEMDPAKKDALQTKIDAAKFSDLLIYIADPNEAKGRSMSTAPLHDYLGTKKASVDEADINGLDGAMNMRFFPVIRQINVADGSVEPVIEGFVREDVADIEANNLAPGETMDRTVGWFHKGKDAEIPGYHIFTRNMGFKDAKAINSAASHAAAIRNTVDQMDRIVTSARYAGATIEFGSQSGLVFDSREALEAEHPRYKARKLDDGTTYQLPITTIGEAMGQSYEIKTKLRRSDQWISVPADSKSYGSMAGKIINGSVWAALDDIHHSQPAINIPAYNTMLRWFKKNKTVWSPGTHMVNAGSNVAWMYLHDIPVRAVADGMRVYYKAKANPSALSPSERALWTAFQKSGALIADYSSTELRKALSEASKDALGEKDSSIWGMTQAMALYERAKASRMGQLVGVGKDAALKADEIAQGMYAAEDNVFRLAAFMSKAAAMEQESGQSLTPGQLLEAGRAAATEFLDYNIHARGVNLLKQTLIPFISWPYRALPAMLKLAIYKPWKVGAMVGAFTLLDALAVAMSGGSDEDKRKRKKLPAYMNERLFGFGPHMYWQVPGMGTADKPVYFKMGAFIPLGDLIQNDNRNGLMGQKWFPSQFTPNGPMVSTLIGALAGVDPFTGQKLDKTTDSQWEAFKKRAVFMEGQMVPPALDLRRGAERWDRVVNDKKGPLGHEYSDSIELAQWVGLRVYQVDLPESAATQKRAVKAIEMEYKKELSRVTREARRFPNKPVGELNDTKAALKERMKKEIERVKNTGEE